MIPSTTSGLTRTPRAALLLLAACLLPLSLALAGPPAAAPAAPAPAAAAPAPVAKAAPAAAPTAKSAPAPVAAPVPAAALGAGAAGAPVPAAAPAPTASVLPDEMLAQLQLSDPSWAQLQPQDQVGAIRTRLNGLPKGDLNQYPLLLTVAWLLDQRVPNARLEAAETYMKLQSQVMTTGGFKYAGQAQLRASELFAELHRSSPEAGFAKRSRKAVDMLVRGEQRLSGAVPLWKRENDGRWAPVDDAYVYSLWRWDQLNKDNRVYQIIDRLVRLTGGQPAKPDAKDQKSGVSQVLALLLLALTLNILTFPLSRKSYRSMREMQRIQPLLQDVQKRYKDNPQKSQEEMMRLYREHGVNPMAGCLPMLIQMPIFIFVYQGVWSYTYNFHGSHVLWIKSLADSDVPLLILYGCSMFFSQKIMMAGQPVTDPAQAQQQKTMSVMMPVMFTYMMYLWRLPSAFYFYWMAFNVFSTSGQLLNRRAMAQAEAAAGLTPVLAPPPSVAPQSGASGGKGTPPAALRPAGRAAKGKRKHP